MAEKKTKSAVPDELDQPTENDVHAGEEVVVADNALGTSADEVPADAGKRSGLATHEPTTSPYACDPVAIDCGPGLATYWVPKHLLRSPKWSTTNGGATVSLPGVSAATGHTLVHYLYTGTYQALEAEAEGSATPAHIRFKQAFLTSVLASTYELQDLERLAKEQIERYGSYMALVEVLNIVRKEFSKTAWSWFHEYLHARAKEQFQLDYTFFTSRAFLESLGKGTLHRFMTCHLLEIFSEKLTHTLQRRESRCLDKEKPDAVLDEVEDTAVRTHRCLCYHGEHQTGMCTASDDMSFEFPSVPCEEVDEVISLENSVCDETPPTPPEPEPVPPPEPELHAESGPKPVSEFKLVKEEEEAERKKREEREEAAAAAAAVSSASADLSWAEPAAANDDWDSFAATTTTGKKKKGKKGKAEPTPPPPPPPSAKPTTTFDDIKLDDVNLMDNGAPKINLNFGDSKDKSGSGLGPGGLGGWSSGWGSSTKDTGSGWSFDRGLKDASGGADNPWYEKKKKDASGFDFEFDAFKGGAAPPAEEKPAEEGPWASGATTTKKKKDRKGKKGALIEEPAPEPVPEPEPEPVKEEPAVDPFVGLSKSQKKKLQEKMTKEAKEAEAKAKEDAAAQAEEDAERKEEEDAAAELAKQEEEAEAERLRLEEEEAEKKRIEEKAAAAAEADKKKADTWGDWDGAAPTTSKKKKKKKGAVEEEPPPPPPEPEPVVEPELEPVPEPVAEEKEEGGDWEFSSIWGGGKKKKKGKNADPEPPPPEPEFAEPLQIEAAVQEPNAIEEPATEQEEFPELEQEHEPKLELTLEEAIPETSSKLCPRRCRHLFEGDSWKSCEQCGARVREIVVQLARDNMTVLL